MHTTVAWSESLDEAGAMAKLAAVPDQHVKVSGDKIYVSSFNHLIGGYAACGSTGDEARLVSPSLRRVNPFYITPVELAIAPVEPAAMRFHPQSAIPLDVNEALEAENDANPAAAEQHAIIAFLAPGAVQPVTGPIWTVNCGITLAQVVNSWEYSEITFPDSLPVANYSIVGARVIASGGIAFRIVPIGESYRPGGIVAQATDDVDPFLQRFGGLGNWVKFSSLQPPGIELLGSAAAASATYEVYLDLVKV